MSVETQEALRATTWLVERYGEDVAVYIDAIPVGKLAQVVERVDDAVVKAVEMASETLDSHEPDRTTTVSVERWKWLSRLDRAVLKGLGGEELLPNEREVVGEAIGVFTDLLAGRLS